MEEALPPYKTSHRYCVTNFFLFIVFFRNKACTFISRMYISSQHRIKPLRIPDIFCTIRLRLNHRMLLHKDDIVLQYMLFSQLSYICILCHNTCTCYKYYYDIIYIRKDIASIKIKKNC